MTVGGAWGRARLVDQRAHTFYEKYGRLLAVVVAVVFVVEIVRIALHPRIGDAVGLLLDAAVAAWFFWPLFRDQRSADGRIVVTTRYARLTWVVVTLAVVAAAVLSLALVR